MSAPDVTSALFLCDGATLPDHLASGRWDRREDILSIGPRAELNLRIDTLSGLLSGEVSGTAGDLLYIACCCLAADQRVNRGSKRIDIHRQKWRRQFMLVLPVTAPEMWNRPDVVKALTEALVFATEDEWTLVFVKRPPETILKTLFGKDVDRATRGDPDCVVLFSGGMDSLCTTVEAIAEQGLRPVALSFKPANQVSSAQTELIQALRRRFPGWSLPHVGFSSHRQGGGEPDPSQRTRAFALVALGSAVAESLGIESVLLADNGYVSINPPISGELAGALASRGTHPTLIRLMNRLVALVFEQPIAIMNPLADRTRAEALEVLKRHDCQDLIANTVTCGKFRSRYQSRHVSHCGVCSQCVDRRFAIIRSGLEDLEPADRYVVDIFLHELPAGEALKIAPMYVEFAQKAARLSPESIFRLVNQLAGCLDPESEDIQRDAYALGHVLWRHSKDVTAVLADMIARYRQELATGDLPIRSLLRFVAGGASMHEVGVAPAGRPTEDALINDTPSLEKRGKYWHFVFQGEKAVVRDRKGFTYVSLLLKAPEQEIGASVLASGGIGEVVDFAQVADAGLRTGSTVDEILDSDGERYLREHLHLLMAERDAEAIPQRADDIDFQIQQIEAHIASTRGLLGRHRTFTDADERARSAVTRAISTALAEIKNEYPGLYLHLKQSINTGRIMVYAPRPPLRWTIAA